MRHSTSYTLRRDIPEAWEVLMSLGKVIAGSLMAATILPQVALPAFSAVRCVPCTQRVVSHRAVIRHHAMARVITKTRIKTVYRTKFVPIAQRPVINNYYVSQQPTAVRTYSAVQPRILTQRVISEPMVAEPTMVGVPVGYEPGVVRSGIGGYGHPILREGALGAALGAGTGAIIGAVTRHHRAGRGALMGAGLGALLGVGHGFMRQDPGIAGRFDPYY